MRPAPEQRVPVGVRASRHLLEFILCGGYELILIVAFVFVPAFSLALRGLTGRDDLAVALAAVLFAIPMVAAVVTAALRTLRHNREHGGRQS